MASAKETASERPVQTKSLFHDTIRPDKDNNFTWPFTTACEIWRFLLYGTTDTLITAGMLNKRCDDITNNIRIFEDAIEDDKGIHVLNTIERIYDTNKALVKESLVFGIAVCSCTKNQPVKTRALELMLKVCDTSMLFLTFVERREMIHRHLRQTTGWSKALRKAIAKWYRHRPVMEMARIMMECPKHYNWRHGDVLRLAHIPPETASERILFTRMIRGLKRTLELHESDDPDDAMLDHQQILNLLKDISTVRVALTTSSMVEVMYKHKFSWKLVPSYLYREAELWERFISIMPFEVMIQNTTRMAKMKLLERNRFNRTRASFQELCGDANLISKSKIHPYQILAEIEMYTNAVNDKHRKPTWKMDPEILSSLNRALKTAMEKNLKAAGKRFFIAIDASKSMKAHITNSDHIQCCTVAAFMALCIVKKEHKAIVKAFSEDFVDIAINSRTTTIPEIIQVLHNTRLGGCDCSRPMIYAKRHKIKADVFVVFTDNDTWQGETTPAEALRQYREALKIGAKLILVALNPDAGKRHLTVVDEDDRGIMEVQGFSATTAKLIFKFSSHPY